MPLSPPTATPIPPDRPRVYADEDIDRPLVVALRQRGFDVLTSQEASTLGQTDEAQLAYAVAIGRVILSYNRLDFRRWHRRFLQAGRRIPSIVLLSQASPLARRVIRASMLLDWLAIRAETTASLANWNDLQRLLHAGYRLPGYSERDVRLALGQADT